MGKRYRLGETHENTLSEQVSRLLRRIAGRSAIPHAAPSDFWALRDIDLDVAEGEALGIVGGNGAGKSTLLKILSRITAPTKGRAVVRGRLSSLLEVGTGFHPELTGRENVFLNGTILGMRKAEVARKFDEIVAFAGVEKFIDTPVKRYSSGMYVRLAFAVAAHLEPDVLIVDEVLAVGDAGFQQRCLGKMSDVARQGRTVLFVSHNMAAIERLCNRAVWLESGVVRYAGPARTAISKYTEAVSPVEGGSDLPAGVLYRSTCSTGTVDAEVLEVELLDSHGRPVSVPKTWDELVFRIQFVVKRSYRSFSVVLSINTPTGTRLVLTSTTPDGTQAFSIDPGVYAVECFFHRVPLSAGDYMVGVGLAIPSVEYVWHNEELARLRIAPQDIYRSGLPPSASRYLVASAHEWNLPVPVVERSAVADAR